MTWCPDVIERKLVKLPALLRGWSQSSQHWSLTAAQPWHVRHTTMQSEDGSAQHHHSHMTGSLQPFPHDHAHGERQDRAQTAFPRGNPDSMTRQPGIPLAIRRQHFLQRKQKCDPCRVCCWGKQSSRSPKVCFSAWTKMQTLLLFFFNGYTVPYNCSSSPV